ncbi:MAG: hypothetical protein K9N23_11425, partial [Akkermansiaceae bacterium]|nr:hypothetical protein [Akkermansiaceae bacterium]
MNTIRHAFLGGTLVTALSLATVSGLGFPDSEVVFYGQVRQVGGGGTILLQAGHLEVTFANQANAANRMSLATDLHPAGPGDSKPYSYFLKVPLAYLPEASRLGDFLSIGVQATDFQIENITIDGRPATLPDGSKEFYGLSFANRADPYRLDLIVTGDSTDSDGDGLPDWWEEQHGLDPGLADANSDFDNDGWSNLEEFRRGSNPAVSNLEPTLATAELLISELGEAGCYLQFYDSDTAASDIMVETDGAALGGFELRLDGAPLPATDAPPLNLAAFQAGRLTIAHRDPAIREAALPLVWTDGGEQKTGSVLIRVVSPSGSEGNDAALWLDAASLASGEALAIWPDRSGNGRNAMQPLAEYQPTVTPLGPHRSVRFAQSRAHLFFQDAALPAGNHTVLAAWQTPGSSTTPQV